jgi:hypothetical protein
MTLNTKLGIVAGSLVIATGVIWGAIWWASNQEAITLTNPEIVNRVTPEVNTNTAEVISDLVARRIDGTLISADQANLWPIAVMIENAAFGGVRPQSGLSAAQVVYELPVEGGITRFLAVFAGDMPEKIGPVRSARPTYLEFSSEYNALYAHAGGSPEALAAVDGLAILDLSALAADSIYFYRDNNLVAPHNLFTSQELLNDARHDKGLDLETPDYETWDFKDDEPTANPSSEPLIYDFGSGPLYSVQYTYHAETNSYDRQDGGDDHLDANTGKVISPKVVIAQMIPAGTPAGTDGRVNFDVTGTGTAYIAQDGEVIEGVWSKTDRASRTVFRDAEGNRIEFNRGSIWISLIPATGSVSLPSALPNETTN